MNRTIDSALLRQMYICLALWFSLASAAVCQDPDDPFGSPDGTMGTTDTFGSADAATTAGPTSSAAPSSYSDTDPFVRRIRENPPTTAPEMAKAITWMVQFRSWETVGSLLDRVAAQNWPLSSKAQIAREISPTVWSQLFRSSGKLTEAQSKILTALYSAPTTYARDPKIIDSLIDQLASPSAAQRQLAQLKLQDGQRASLKRLVDRLLDGDTKVPAKILAETVVLFDRDGVDALRAACNLQDASRSSRVVLSLADLSSNEFSSELAAALHSGRYPTEVKQSLAEKIQTRYTRIPSQATTTDYLTKKFQSALDDYQTQRTNSGLLTNTIWQPTADGKITARDVTADIAALERLCQVACLLSQLEVVEPAVDSLTTVMQLQRAYQLNPTLVDAEFAAQLIQPLPVDRSEDPAFWVDVFRQASSRQMHGAAIRSLQLLHAHVQAGKPAPLDFLSELLSDGRPVVRYLALEIIATADPRANFAGSERALTTALEMSQLSQGPQALIIGANNELCMAAEQMIQLHTGSKSVVVTSARGAFQSVTKQNPIELIMVVDRVHDMSLFELLQRLRNSGSLPIAVLVERLYQHEQDFIQKGAGFYTSTLSRDPDQMKQVIDQLTRTLDVRPMTSDDRIRFTSLAASFLTKISADRNTYAFYPVSEWHEQMVSLPAVVRPQAQSQLLSGLGSKESQRKLTAIASTSGVSEQDRFAAARSFETSVRQFGMLLSDQEVKGTYELYNRLGPNDPAIAKAMGYILDIIEAQAGSRLWPDPL